MCSLSRILTFDWLHSPHKNSQSDARILVSQGAFFEVMISWFVSKDLPVPKGKRFKYRKGDKGVAEQINCQNSTLVGNQTCNLAIWKQENYFYPTSLNSVKCKKRNEDFFWMRTKHFWVVTVNELIEMLPSLINNPNDWSKQSLTNLVFVELLGCTINLILI